MTNYISTFVALFFLAFTVELRNIIVSWHLFSALPPLHPAPPIASKKPITKCNNDESAQYKSLNWLSCYVFLFVLALYIND